MTLPIAPDIFARIRSRAALVIAKYGAPVAFSSPDIPATEDPETHIWSDVVPGAHFSGVGIQTAGQSDAIILAAATATLVLKNPVTVLVAALNLGGVPTPGMIMTWGEIDYDIALVLPVAPNTKPVYYTIVGDA
jgi:hypothetical protein